MLFELDAAPPADLPLAAEPSDIDHKSSNPPPVLPNFVDAAAEDFAPVFTGDVTADRADNGLITGIAAYAGAVAGVELGRSCCGASGVLSAPKGWGCTD